MTKSKFTPKKGARDAAFERWVAGYFAGALNVDGVEVRTSGGRVGFVVSFTPGGTYR